MTDETLGLPRHLFNGLRQVLAGPQGLALLSGAMLMGYWFGGEGLLLIAGLSIPAVIALASVTNAQTFQGRQLDGLTGLPLRQGATAEMELLLAEAPRNGRATACFAVGIDEFAALRRTHGAAALDEIVQRVAERLQSVLRDTDIVARLDDSTFAVIPAALRSANLETAIQLAARMQSAVAEPISINAMRVYVSVTVGFVLPRQIDAANGTRMLEAAELALAVARQQGPGSIRAHNAAEKRGRVGTPLLTLDVVNALENDQIQAWFQPQISTDTGEVAGFEALARWVHPKHGVLSPAEFLPAVGAAGRMDQLGTLMLHRSLTALRDWHRVGLEVPTVSVNLGEEELRNPALPDHVRWELDRFDLKPERLCIEILETVLTPSTEDVMTRNIAQLSGMGVAIDLDDFGTGTASIAAIRRFDVHRIKIDRSFVSRIDQDRGQQDMVAAILSMAERLGLQTLAEGVETIGEHAMLAQLGCGTVQGFGVAAPMPFADTLNWMHANSAKIAETRSIRRRVT
ncbi:putative bifunctional diguanylate cyclase/phosphodiesterase [Frigidibacter sp. ROC022]|uniref:putative bifunctional diguanylate cyclase/phosphodiesterase n=1 Tax=Frigidibacter sp. ROC022 TaxID=2971796 RepID=UPI00215A4360|nr:bifunctional diguanylate cyclase/phosphodiesterase [Frigidibacter sp. ROC022]MCR8725920.1 bifunctional diguanylate cyclase/phosphodiesterase [Frigidibacter sp. ROC022]